jgi:hypothetical protein
VTVTAAFVTALGLAAPVAVPATAATQSAVAMNPDRSPGNARMTDGRGKQVQAFELELSAAPTVLFSEPANPSTQDSFSRWGAQVTASFTYRARYFLSPTIRIGHVWLASGDATIPDNQFYGPGGDMEQSLSAWIISPGVTFPFWRFRLTGGIGLAIADQTNTLNGDENSSSQAGLMNTLALSFDAIKTERTRLAVELMSGNSDGLKLHWLALGVSFRGDIYQWD